MTSDRPHRKALSVAEAVAELKRNSGTQFDARIAERFVELITQRPVEAATAAKAA
jgi:HD-GYP domain-containing protein (c-di-GMP phosphodiesterase class II)